MSLFVIGLNHKTASVDLREMLAFDTQQSLDVLELLKTQFADTEFALLSTCNRVELYVANKNDTPDKPEAFFALLAGQRDLQPEAFDRAVYTHRDADAIKHLLTVTSSLDSMVVGEPQITAQVKDCYNLACQARTTGKILNRLFHCAFATGKEVYANTSIARRRVSVAGVAVDLVRQLFSDFSQMNVLVLGVGEMGELVLQHLIEHEAKNITIANRTLSRAKSVAKKYNLCVGDWEQRFERMVSADVVIAAAATEDFLLTQQQCKDIRKKRRHKTLLLIDIAVPRILDPAINELDDVYLYAIDDLSQVIQENLQAREEDRKQADIIIQENVLDFLDWLDVLDLGPLLGQMKDKFHDISHKELACFLAGNPDLQSETRQRIEKLVNRLVNKQMHCLIHNFNEMARDNNPADVLDLVNRIIQHPDQRS